MIGGSGGKKQGFTLVEVLVSMAIFSVILTTITGMFFMVFRAQRRSLVLGETIFQTKHAIEYMSRHTRMAKKDTGGVCIGAGDDYVITARGGLAFMNYKDECMEFFTEDNKVKVEIDGKTSDLTSDNFNVTNFKLELTGGTGGDYKQAYVIIAFKIESADANKAEEQYETIIQTSISQRNIDF